MPRKKKEDGMTAEEIDSILDKQVAEEKTRGPQTSDSGELILDLVISSQRFLSVHNSDDKRNRPGILYDGPEIRTAWSLPHLANVLASEVEGPQSKKTKLIPLVIAPNAIGLNSVDNGNLYYVAYDNVSNRSGEIISIISYKIAVSLTTGKTFPTNEIRSGWGFFPVNLKEEE